MRDFSCFQKPGEGTWRKKRENINIEFTRNLLEPANKNKSELGKRVGTKADQAAGAIPRLSNRQFDSVACIASPRGSDVLFWIL